MRIFVRFLLLMCSLLMALPAQAAESTQSVVDRPLMSRIIGGTVSDEGAWPWMVALTFNEWTGSWTDTQFCGGSLIHSQYVLTAAHCVDGLIPTDLSVVYGSNNLASSGGTEVQVESIIMHESYDRVTLKHDIALLKLVQPLQLEVISVANSGQLAALPDRELLMTMGWGVTSTAAGTSEDQLRQVELPLVSNAMCNLAYPNLISDQMMCAGYQQGGKDSCWGDSGGPLLLQLDQQWYQAGVVSWGKGCAEADAYGVYTRIPAYLNWIAHWVPEVVDSDQDGIADSWELDHFSGLETATATSDYDGDGLIDLVEVQNGTDPQVAAVTFDQSIPETLWGGESGETAGWWVDTDDPFRGEGSLRSGGVENGQQSTVQLTGTFVNGVVRFSRKVSSELHFDRLLFKVDGALVASWSGEQPWEQFEYPLAAGEHLLSWSYEKDDRGSHGEDAAWIDDVEVVVQEMLDTDQDGWSDSVELTEGSDPDDVSSTPDDQDQDGTPDRLDEDRDGDGIADSWELEYFDDLTVADALSDSDGDGVTDQSEYQLGSNPLFNTESFEEGVTEGWTLKVTGEQFGWEITETEQDSGRQSLQSEQIGGDQRAVMQYVGYLQQGVIQFRTKVSSEENYDFLRFEVNGKVQGEWSGEIPWSTVQFPVTEGHYTLQWIYVKDDLISEGSDRVWIDEVEIPSMSLEDSDLDGIADSWEQSYFPGLTIATAVSDSDGDQLTDLQEFQINSHPQVAAYSFESGQLPQSWGGISTTDQEWSVEQGASFNGVYRLTSAETGRNQQSAIGFSGYFNEGVVRFALKVSSEEGYDELIYRVDGSVVDRWSGEVGWRLASFPVVAGEHTLSWSYEKDRSVFSGEDRAWIDWVELDLDRSDDSDQDGVPDQQDPFPENSHFSQDQDEDQIADLWEQTHFGSLERAGLETDADQDGQSDREEFESGTDPLFVTIQPSEETNQLTPADYQDVEVEVELQRGPISNGHHYRQLVRLRVGSVEQRRVDQVQLQRPDGLLKPLHEVQYGVWQIDSGRLFTVDQLGRDLQSGSYQLQVDFIDGHQQQIDFELLALEQLEFPQGVQGQFVSTDETEESEVNLQWSSALDCNCHSLQLFDLTAFMSVGERSLILSQQNLSSTPETVYATSLGNLPAGEYLAEWITTTSTDLSDRVYLQLSAVELISKTASDDNGRIVKVEALVLSPGWNLVGGVEAVDSTAITQFLEAQGGRSVWGWDQQRWSSFVLGVPEQLNTLQQMEPGKGYFLKIPLSP